MNLTKKSEFTGIEHSLELPITKIEYNWGIIEMNKGKNIQNVFPQLNDNEREFILTGVTKEEWDEFIGEEEDDDMFPGGDISLEDDDERQAF
jgi:hypothetical protein